MNVVTSAGIERFTTSRGLVAELRPVQMRGFSADGSSPLRWWHRWRAVSQVDRAGTSAAQAEHGGEIADLAEGFALRPVWVVPCGTTAAAVLDAQRRLADAILGRGWNLSTRLHIVL